MCGIMGYVGARSAASVLIDGLARLEYRGYDSAGVAIAQADGTITVMKTKGRVASLAAMLEEKKTDGAIGIGHTRWATHGAPTEKNAHPHGSGDGMVFGVHNGIIENFKELRDKLVSLGYSFTTETDTEVAVCLVRHHLKRLHDPICAMSAAQKELRGSYAMAFLFRDAPNVIYAMRKDSPLIVGVGKSEMFLASDIPAIMPHTKYIFSMKNGDMARISADGANFFDAGAEPIEKVAQKITLDAETAEKGGFAHFMMKEICEQPSAVRRTLHALAPSMDVLNVGLSSEELQKIRAVHIVACGSAYHAGLVSAPVIERLSHVPVRVELASEFRYREPILSIDDLVILISQSGETADTIGALREAKRRGIMTLAIVNVRASSMATLADRVIYTMAGPEIAVATTKAYSAQLVALDVFALALGCAKRAIGDEDVARMVASLAALPEQMEILLEEKKKICALAEIIAEKNDAFFIGRGQGFAVCEEGSLKLKEISYIHAEAYAAGELKHGTLSLIEKHTPVIGVVTDLALHEKTVANMMEAKSRGAFLIGIGEREIPETDVFLSLPSVESLFMPSLAAIPLQLLGYYAAVLRGHDVDKPRNLAKSVTVE